MIEVIKLSKKYHDQYALQNVSVTMNSGEIVGLVGKNGAGKTTFLESIAGLIKPTDGEIKINGKKDYNYHVIGYLEDNPYFYDYLTVKEIIHYYYLMQNKKIKSEKSDQLLLDYGLLEKRDVMVKELSRGMKQKLAFLLAIVHNPKILLLDEPFTGLDPVNLKMMKNKLSQLKKKGITIVLSTHILSFASNICDRVLFLDKGKITYILEGSRLTEKALEEKFNEYVV
ncbi:ABC transporter ATP-binding protein [Fervidibacillus albus]|uniref:ABC transporter ATP-binding protein n=1 Tax=Fervidibacillus albus TaxID=2980026 RepID=A0A9E8LUC4_9BACI|nr:ABC transporter ATP-binding protein [Fervidibacillus albus]WAA09515.1 ABC transporter ATP-binding protein [Fervidibacillus albus]